MQNLPSSDISLLLKHLADFLTKNFFVDFDDGLNPSAVGLGISGRYFAGLPHDIDRDFLR